MPKVDAQPFLPRLVAVTGLGVVCALGDDAEVVDRLRAEGHRGIRPHPPLDHLPDDLAAVVPGPDLKPWLKRRKDLKLMARPAELALAAAGRALGDVPVDLADVGLYVGVGREPPDTGDSEPALAASQTDGVLDEKRLAGPGRDRYPPLLPLKTLPNMALAHVSMNLGIGGPNGAWAGGPAASLRAVEAALWAVAEGRAELALAGGADSLVDLGSARDRLRAGATGPPGEAAVFLRLESLEGAWKRRAPLYSMLVPASPLALLPGPVLSAPDHRAAVGDCGAADGALAVLFEIMAARRTGLSRTVVLADPGTPRIALRVRAPLAC